MAPATVQPLRAAMLLLFLRSALRNRRDRHEIRVAAAGPGGLYDVLHAYRREDEIILEISKR